jgi:hypothetical protein
MGEELLAGRRYARRRRNGGATRWKEPLDLRWPRCDDPIARTSSTDGGVWCEKRREEKRREEVY